MSPDRPTDGIVALNEVYEFHVLDADEPPPGSHGKVLLEYWNAKRGTRAYPCWDDIELMDLYAVAELMIVKDVIDGGKDFINRYWGSGLTRSAGFDGTGKRHSELYESQPSGPQFETYHAAITHGAPIAVHRDSSFIAGREYVTYDALHVPVGDAETSVITHLITVHDFVLRSPPPITGPQGRM